MKKMVFAVTVFVVLGAVSVSVTAQSVTTTAVVLPDVNGFHSDVPFSPHNAADGGHKLAHSVDGTLHMVYYNKNETAGNHELVYARSVDNGGTWIPEVLDVTPLTAINRRTGYFPSVAVSGSGVYIVCSVARTDPGTDLLNYCLYLIKRTNYGATEAARALIVTRSAWEPFNHTDIAVADSGHIYVAVSHRDYTTYSITHDINDSTHDIKVYAGTDRDIVTDGFITDATFTDVGSAPLLVLADSGDVYLAYDVFYNLNLSGRDASVLTKDIKIHKRSAGGAWDSAAGFTPIFIRKNYRVQHADMLVNNDKLYVVYSRQDRNGALMTLGYRLYNAGNGAEIFAGDDIVGEAAAIFTPRIALVDGTPFIRYITGSAISGYSVMQTMYLQNRWRPPVKIDGTDGAVYLHMLKDIPGSGQAEMLWYNLSTKSIGFGIVPALLP